MSSDDNQRDGDDGDDDTLLRALGARARTRRTHLDEGGDADPRAAEVLAPFDAAARARFADAIQDRVRGDAGARPPAPAVHPISRGRRRVFVAAGASGLLAAAAAIVLFVAGPARVVPYALEIDGGDRPTRSASNPGEPATGEPPVLAPDSSLEIRARPARSTPVDGAAAYVRAAGDPHAALVGTAPEISAEGVVRWRGTARELFGDRRGDLEIRVVIGRAAFMSPEQAFSGDGGGGAGSQMLVARVRVRAHP